MSLEERATKPVLGDRAQAYRRNVLTLSVAALTIYLSNNVQAEDASLFGLQLGNNIWKVGGLLLLYQLIMYRYHLLSNMEAYKTVPPVNIYGWRYFLNIGTFQNNKKWWPLIKYKKGCGLFFRKGYDPKNQGNLVYLKAYKISEASLIRARNIVNNRITDGPEQSTDNASETINTVSAYMSTEEDTYEDILNTSSNQRTNRVPIADFKHIRRHVLMLFGFDIIVTGLISVAAIFVIASAILTKPPTTTATPYHHCYSECRLH